MTSSMIPTRRALTGGLALLAGLALITSACGDSKTAAPTTTAPTVSDTTVAESTQGSQTVTIPLNVDTSSSSGARVIVQASIGGGPTVPMLLDTGSSGVVVAATALGSEVQLTTEQAQEPYVNVTVDGVVADATVTMGSLTTSGPIQVVAAQSATCESSSGTTSSCSLTGAFGDGVEGIIGIGLSNGPSPASPNYSPLMQVAAPYGDGFVLQLPASGSGAGSLVVGPVSAPSGAVSVPLVASTSPTYPNGAKAWAKDVELCWTVALADGCGPTDLDIGNPMTILTPSAIPGVPAAGSGEVTSGSKVTVSPSQGASPLWSFTAGTTVSNDLTLAENGLGSATAFNTGIAFFFANVVGYDSANARLVFWPQGS
jgi:predicted aspartyl protease